MDYSKTILISPLDWGLGHTTRIIPVIWELISQKIKVIVAADGRAYDLLKKEFSDLEIIRLPGISMQYPKGKWLALKLALKIPSYLKQIHAEQKLIEVLAPKYQIDIIISDNRYGLWSKKCYNIFITHQLQIKAPGFWKIFETVIRGINYRLIRKFDECWIPDFPQMPGLSGALGHPQKFPVPSFYIGPLSRFSAIKKTPEEKKYDFLGIVSGPEPQRTTFQNLLISQFKLCGKKCALVCGLPNQHEVPLSVYENITLIPHLKTSEFFNLVQSSEIVICRAGYSGIMDMVAMKKKAILIPTPGQTEQEYLAKILMDSGMFFSVTEEKFDLQKNVFDLENFNKPEIKDPEELLKKSVKRILQIDN